MTESLIERLRTRAHIRRTIRAEKSEGKVENDRIADLLDEAADKIEELEEFNRPIPWVEWRGFNE